MAPCASTVESMFSNIAERYDFANHVLSGGIDFYWRKKLVDAVADHKPKTILDLATGSGDVAFALCKRLRKTTAIHGLDFCERMLEQARIKRNKQPRFRNVSFGYGDCTNLPAENDSFDAITIAFGLRNLECRSKGLKEMRRVLKPGGKLFVLEFSQPVYWVQPAYYFYIKKVLPKLASWTTKNEEAYQYLGNSIQEFPTQYMLSKELYHAGFQEVENKGMTLGIVALHAAIA